MSTHDPKRDPALSPQPIVAPAAPSGGASAGGPVPSRTPIASLADRQGHEASHTDSVRQMFDRLARRYDRMNRLLSFGTDVRWRSEAVAALAPIQPGKILDLCAGTLDMSALLEKAFPAHEIVATDFSEAMLARGLEQQKTTRTKTVVADAQALPWEDGAFSAVVCAFGLRNLADLSAALKEAHRVLQPGGVLLVLEFFRPSRPLTRTFHRAYASTALPALGRLLSGEPAAYGYLARSMSGFVCRTAFEDRLVETGFTRVVGRDLLIGIASVVRAERAELPSRSAPASTRPRP